MRPMRVFGSALGVLAFVGCVTPAGGPTSSRYETSAAPVMSREARVQAFEQVRDSLNAQAIADREGPGVNIRVEMTNVSGSRHARAAFSLEDDAYVVVGHIDADGVVRLTFPGSPSDDGFLKGDRGYRTPEFFAGFLQEYRYRATTGLFHYTTATPDSYDGGLGYVFVIASWRPMHFDRFSTQGVWDTFELADADYIHDPRPAIYELASLLAGENREAYTVKFARYTSTTVDGGGVLSYSSLASSGFGGGYCNGYAPLGFAWSPFSGSSYANFGYSDFDYRGTRYLYNSFGDCYTTYRGGGFGYYGTTIAQTPTNPPTTPRVFNIDKGHAPPTPQPLPGYKLPTGGASAPSGAAADPNGTTPRVSTHYRDRGLITADDGSTTPTMRNPRVDARTGEQPTRPSIQQMINRHDDGDRQAGNRSGANSGSNSGSEGWSRSGNPRGNGGNGSNGSSANPTPRNDGGGQSGERQRQFSPDGRNAGGQQQPRSEPARVAPSAPSPAPSYSTPRAAPSSPPPAPVSAPAPASPPASSAGSVTPIKP